MKNNNVIKNINLSDINPYIRVVRIHTLEKGFKSSMRYNRHYQLHYIFEGTGHFHIGTKDYTAKKGELCLWAPGQVHSIASSKESPLKVAGIQFDFTRNFKDDNYLPVSYHANDFKETYINEIISFNDFEGFKPYIKLNNPILIEGILWQIENYFLHAGKYREVLASTELKKLFMIVASNLENSTLSKTNQNTDKILNYINNNFTYEITNKKIAKEFGYHPVHLNRLILDITGLSLHQYVLKLRISKALHLIHTTNLSINIIANMVGYSNPQYFSRLIKLKTGYPPSYFRT